MQDQITKKTMMPLYMVISIVSATIIITAFLIRLDSRVCNVEEKVDKIVRALEKDGKIVALSCEE